VTDQELQAQLTRYVLGFDRGQALAPGAIQAFLDLSLKLRIEHFRRQHERHAREHVLGEQFDALRLQVVQFDEALHRLKETVAQAGFMGAAGGRRNQVDIGFA